MISSRDLQMVLSMRFLFAPKGLVSTERHESGDSTAPFTDESDPKSGR